MTKPRKLYVLLDGFMRALRPCPAFTAPTSSALNMTFPAITNPGRLVFLLSPSGRLAEEIAPPHAAEPSAGDAIPTTPSPPPSSEPHRRGTTSTATAFSLAEAREKAVANRSLAREGGDPLADKRRVQGIPTFAEATVTAGRSGLLLR